MLLKSVGIPYVSIDEYKMSELSDGAYVVADRSALYVNNDRSRRVQTDMYRGILPGQISNQVLTPEGTPVIKMLFLAADPSDETRLRLGEESREIEARIRAAEHRNRFKVVKEFSVRVSDITERMLRHKPTIVHFSGHGSRLGGLIFENDAGKGQEVSSEALVRMFKVFNRSVRCIVLNACYSEATASLFKEHIDCVVGMSKAIGDKAAINFAWSFYQALAYAEDLQTAFDLAVAQLHAEGLGEEDTPKLICRNGIDPSQTKLVGV
jgi:hypothetical protein